MLGEVGEAGLARESLLDAMEREESMVASIAIAEALVLRAEPDDLPRIIAVFLSERSSAELYAKVLAAVGTGSAYSALVDVAADGSGSRSIVAQGFLRRFAPEALPILEDRVRRAPTPVLVRLLGEARSPSSIPLLLPLISDTLLGRDALGALASIADPRLESLASELVRAGEVDRSAAIELLRAVAGPASSDLWRELLESETDNAQQLRLLQALLLSDPVAGAEVLRGWAESTDPERVQIAANLAIESPSVELLPVLYGFLLQDDADVAQAAARAIAEVPGGAGLRVLIQEVGRRPAAISLAISLRRWPEADQRNAGLEALRGVRASFEESDHRMLRALARDPQLADELIEVIRELERAPDEHELEEWAKHAGLLGDRSLAPDIAQQLERGGSLQDSTFAAISLACSDLRCEPSLRALLALEGTPLEPFAILPSANAQAETRYIRDEHRRWLRRLLRNGAIDAQVNAAWVLAEIGDEAAIPSLVDALSRVESATLRETLEVSIARLGLERFPRLERALRREYRAQSSQDASGRLAIASSGQRLSAPIGDEVLSFDVQSTRDARPWVNIDIPGGTWRRVKHSGPYFLPGLPPTRAEVTFEAD